MPGAGVREVTYGYEAPGVVEQLPRFVISTRCDRSSHTVGSDEEAVRRDRIGDPLER